MFTSFQRFFKTKIVNLTSGIINNYCTIPHTFCG